MIMRFPSISLALFVLCCLAAGFFPARARNEGEPFQFRLRQVMMEARISPDREREVRSRALDCLEKAHNGKDFADLARTFSEEPGADKTGGDLGYFSFGDMVEPFSKAVFSMETGEIRGPVKTQFGYHIIKLLGIRGDTRRARHILFMLTPGRQDTLAVLDTLSGMRGRLLEGVEFTDVLAADGVNDLIRETDGWMVWQTPDMMLPSFVEAIEGLEPGDITRPFISLIGFHIVLVDSINYNRNVVLEGFPPSIEEGLKKN